MTTISAKTVLRSRNTARPEHVCSTLLCRYPRWIHAEARTHRQESIGEDLEVAIATPGVMECPDLSRNAASSRAIPVDKLIRDVLADPAEPIVWTKNEPGMQGYQVLTGADLEAAKFIWRADRGRAIDSALRLASLGAHKQIVNRIVEPHSHITVLITATEWTNFLAVRDHPAAEPHIQMLAREIRGCLEDESTIQDLEPGQWHTPFIQHPADLNAVYAVMPHASLEEKEAAILKLSVSRCASTSYKTVDGFDMTLERATGLHDKLVGSQPMHASPAEHVCQADGTWDEEWASNAWRHPEQHGNFVGFRQYRKMLPGECL